MIVICRDVQRKRSPDLAAGANAMSSEGTKTPKEYSSDYLLLDSTSANDRSEPAKKEQEKEWQLIEILATDQDKLTRARDEQARAMRMLKAASGNLMPATKALKACRCVHEAKACRLERKRSLCGERLPFAALGPF